MSDQSNASCGHLVSFSTASGASHSAGLIEDHHPALLYDMIAFLSAAQWRKIDFLPITWQPALNTAGRGATAEIQQSIINLALTLYFKRFWTSSDPSEISKCYRAIISELCILGHPSIKQHPNIVKLQGICWDVISEDKVWPVLVFKKAKYGNLYQFLASDEASLLKPNQCINLIAGVAHAVEFMHSFGQFAC